MINDKSELARSFWETGRPEDCPIVDMHAHMHEFAGAFLPSAEPEEMLRTMDRCGTRLAVFCSHLALTCPEVGEQANIAPVRAHPGRFRAYHAVLAGDLDIERDSARVRDNPDVYAGFKFHCDWQGIRLSDDRLRPYWEYAGRNRLLALIHTWGGSEFDGVDEARKIAERYHDLTLICGHSFHGDWENGFALARQYPNVYLELTAVLDDRGVPERMAAAVGSEKILFGTDLPWFSTHYSVGALLSADITDEDRHNILHRNAEKLLGLSCPGQVISARAASCIPAG